MTIRIPPRALRAILISLMIMLAAAIPLTLLLRPSHKEGLITYNGKTLESWFYGSRTDFFQEPTRRAAREAIGALGTNACPFLFSALKENRASGILYFRLYHSLPVRVQARLPYPILADDIKSISLQHLAQMRGLPSEQVQALADCVPRFKNPRLRMSAFQLIRMNHQTHPAFLKLSRALLNDQHPGIQLEAAISLAESALRPDLGDPKVFPILLTALQNKPLRESSREVGWYRYQQMPPGGSGPPPFFSRTGFVPDEDQELVKRIIQATYRLEPSLTPEQKDGLNQARNAARAEAKEKPTTQALNKSPQQ